MPRDSLRGGADGASGGWHDGRGGRAGCGVRRVLWGELKDLMQEKSKEGHMMTLPIFR
jgi:hypothetical protein